MPSTNPNMEPFPVLVARLAALRGWTREDVAKRVDALEQPGASRSTFIQALRDPRKLNRAVIEQTASVLGTKPDDFAEWRPLVVRDAMQLDNGNLGQVVENLRIVESKPSERALARMPSAPRRRSDAKEYEQLLGAAAQRPAERRGEDDETSHSQHRRG